MIQLRNCESFSSEKSFGSQTKPVGNLYRNLQQTNPQLLTKFKVKGFYAVKKHVTMHNTFHINL